MPVHGVHTATTHADPFPIIRQVIESMLRDDPERIDTTLWQHESDGSCWPCLDAIMTRIEQTTGHARNIYHAQRVATLAAMGYPDGF